MLMCQYLPSQLFRDHTSSKQSARSFKIRETNFDNHFAKAKKKKRFSIRDHI